MQILLESLVSRLKTAYGDDLVSVILFGSAAAGEFHEKYSDLNVLCVLKSVGLEELEKGEDAVRWWRKQKQPIPLLLTREAVENSHDAFAIEFLDMQTSHRVLFGEDVVASLEIKMHHHRRQVEHEMRSGLLRLRERYLESQRSMKDVARLMLDSLPTFSTLFRHALILGGGVAPTKKREIFQTAASRFLISAEPFLTLLEAREGKRKLADAEIRPLFGAYLAEITRMTTAVDKL